MSHRVSLCGAACAIAALAAPAAAIAQAANSLAPGLYEGTGRLTGGFTGKTVKAAITGGGQFKFCARVGHTGRVIRSKSHWAIEPAKVSVRVGTAGGTGKIDGYGTLGAYVRKHGNLFIALSGNERVTLTVHVLGISTALPAMSFAARGNLPVDRRTANGFSGDLALAARSSQQSAGLSSTEQAKYTAKRVNTCTVSKPPNNP